MTTFAQVLSEITGDAAVTENGDGDELVLALRPGRAATWEPDGGSQPVEWVTRNLSNAQLLAYDPLDPETYLEVMPALSGREYYSLEAAIVHYRAGDTPFDAVNNIQLYSADVQYAYSVEIPEFDFTSAVDLYGKLTIPASGQGGYPGGIPATVIEGGAAAVVLAPLDEFTGGDGTLTVRILFSVIDGTPA